MGKMKELFMEMNQSGSEQTDYDYQFDQYLERNPELLKEYVEYIEREHQKYKEYLESQKNGNTERN